MELKDPKCITQGDVKVTIGANGEPIVTGKDVCQTVNHLVHVDKASDDRSWTTRGQVNTLSVGDTPLRPTPDLPPAGPVRHLLQPDEGLQRLPVRTHPPQHRQHLP